MEDKFYEGQQLNIDIKKIGINGEGIGYFEKMAIFVDGVLPDENVDVEIKKIFDNRLIAKSLKIHKESEFRVTPFCPIYDKCGGCQLQHLSPEKIKDVKRDILKESIFKYTRRNIPEEVIKETISSDKEQGYRNKASLPMRFNGKNHVGMFQANSKKFIQMDDCPVQDPIVNEVINEVTSLLNIYKIKSYDEKYKDGEITSIIVRVSSLNEAQVTFVSLRNISKLTKLADELLEKDQRVKSVFLVIDKKMDGLGFFNSSIKKLAGKDTISEEMHTYKFELKPEAFFQLNVLQADKFYTEMVRLAALKKHDVVIDAFAGSAPISHYVASSVRQVYAIEIDKQACESARMSLQKNNINNVTVLQSDFKRALSGMQKKKIDVMFFDPPRVGLGEETIALILNSKPRKIVYGSCNPSTLGKDLNLLMKLYKIVEVIPLDMFPQTSLVESITLLELK